MLQEILKSENQKEGNSKERKLFFDEDLQPFEEMQILRERELNGVRMEMIKDF